MNTKLEIILSKKAKTALEIKQFKNDFEFAQYFKKHTNIIQAIIDKKLYYRCKDKNGFIRFTDGVKSTIYIEAGTYQLF